MALAPTVQQGALDTYLTHITEQIWLAHSNYNSNGQHTIWAYRLKLFANMCQQITNCNFNFTSHYCQICAIYIYGHKIGAYMPNILCAYLGDVCA